VHAVRVWQWCPHLQVHDRLDKSDLLRPCPAPLLPATSPFTPLQACNSNTQTHLSSSSQAGKTLQSAQRACFWLPCSD
jgi:hypothetical protein